ncbi:hypothetical protein LF844_14720 [Metapseudomonas lalkuanensis]|uniref:hypothetical protein n=1 Tax=Metapseudomonas lalkuanensis TaxID=2604832 RepID=UPI001CF1DE61|nr:hypothetical protein [Pseudomonas lalkuanensis]UCO95949.1 hypothetical protein LF844_14720 [Pseudomonas lalkuanensis]
MNIDRRYLPAALLTFAGLVAATTSHLARAVPLFTRRVDQLVVPIAGTLTTASEDINLSGAARIRSTEFSDPDFKGPPGAILFIDFVNVVGVGLTSKTRFFAHGEQQVVRELRPTDVVELTFLITPVNARATAEAIPVLATFQLTFNVDQGQLTAATGSFSTPDF